MKNMILFQVQSENYVTRFITAVDSATAISAYQLNYPRASRIITKELCLRDDIIPTCDPVKEFTDNRDLDSYDEMRERFYSFAPLKKVATMIAFMLVFFSANAQNYDFRDWKWERVWDVREGKVRRFVESYIASRDTVYELFSNDMDNYSSKSFFPLYLGDRKSALTILNQMAEVLENDLQISEKHNGELYDYYVEDGMLQLYSNSRWRITLCMDQIESIKSQIQAH